MELLAIALIGCASGIGIGRLIDEYFIYQRRRKSLNRIRHEGEMLVALIKSAGDEEKAQKIRDDWDEMIRRFF